MQTKKLILSLTFLTSISHGAQTALLRVVGSLRAVSSEGAQIGQLVQASGALGFTTSLSRCCFSQTAAVKKNEFSVHDEVQKSSGPSLGGWRQVRALSYSTDEKKIGLSNVGIGLGYGALVYYAAKLGIPTEYHTSISALAALRLASSAAILSKSSKLAIPFLGLNGVSVPVAGLGMACTGFGVSIGTLVGGVVLAIDPDAAAELFANTIIAAKCFSFFATETAGAGLTAALFCDRLGHGNSSSRVTTTDEVEASYKE